MLDHIKETIDVLAAECGQEECGHEDVCPTEGLAVCGPCLGEYLEENEIDPGDDYIIPSEVIWPCEALR